MQDAALTAQTKRVRQPQQQQQRQLLRKRAKADETTAAEAKDAGDLKTVSIQIDGSAVPYYAPLYLAQENGYFAEEGLNVEFYYAAAADIVKNVAAGNVEFGFPNADAVVAAKAQGIPVKVVHTTYQEGLGAIIFGSDSGISTPADLKGQKVAVTSLEAQTISSFRQLWSPQDLPSTMFRLRSLVQVRS